jgi:hypothetical protein
MSSLLEQAFVDAKALKEAALKNAEASIVEKYSDEVRQTLNQILEQDELGLGAPMGAPMDAAASPQGDIAQDVPLGAAEGEELCACDEEGEESKVTINFDELAESLKALKEELGDDTEDLEENEEFDINEEDLAALLEAEDEEDITEEAPPGVEAAAEEEADSDAMEKAGLEEASGADEDGEEEVDAAVMGEGEKKPDGDGDGVPPWADKDDTDKDVQEEKLNKIADAIAEKLTVDMGADLTGWAGRRAEDTKHAMEKEIAHRRSTDVQEELEDLKKAQEELVFENNQLKEQIHSYEKVVESLKESVTDVNLSNARLLYTNRVLRNTSLNERQKHKIAEAISKAGSVTEAKTIFETLQSTVEAKPRRSPQSLSEAINRRSSILRASPHSETTTVDPVADRMKKLAGIN